MIKKHYYAIAKKYHGDELSCDYVREFPGDYETDDEI